MGRTAADRLMYRRSIKAATLEMDKRKKKNKTTPGNEWSLQNISENLFWTLFLTLFPSDEDSRVEWVLTGRGAQCALTCVAVP